LNITFIYVTHDQEEALTMSDRIVIMDQGVLQQIGTPVDIYESPETRFVATFIGETNLFEGYVSAIDGDTMTVTTETGSMTCPAAGYKNKELLSVSVRPERMQYSLEPVEGFDLKAKVKDQVYVGSVLKTIAKLPNGNEIKIERLAGAALPDTGYIYLHWNLDDGKRIHNFDQVFFDAVENMTLA
ncbi:MAG: TOBE domain-containing protein, partial [Eubacteriales bacterium]